MVYQRTPRVSAFSGQPLERKTASRALFLCQLVLSLALTLQVADAAAGPEAEVSLGRIEDGSAFFVDTARPVQYRWFELSQPPRLVIDIPGSDWQMKTPDLDLSDSQAIRIRSGYRAQEQRLRIVFDLREKTQASVTTTQSPRQGAQRILVSLSPLSRERAQSRVTSSNTVPPAAESTLPAEPAEDKAGELKEERAARRSYDLEFSGTWEQEWAIETDGGDAQKFEALVEPRIDLGVGDLRITGIARIRLDSVGDLGPDQSSPPNYSDANGPLANTAEAELSLRELYVDFELGPSFWRVGKQQVVWGEADGLKVLDVVNPQSFREFIMDDFDDSRIPLWMASAELPVGADGNLQLLWIPDTTYHELAEPGTPYFFSSPQRVPAQEDGVFYILERPDKPSDLSDGDIGGRYSVFLNGWDVSFNYLYRYLDIPVFYQSRGFRNEQPTVTVTPGYERSHLGGMTLSNAMGDFTLRAEIVYNSDTYFTSRDLDNRGVTESAEVSSVIGLDWQLGSLDTFISGQWFQSHLLDHERDTVRSETTQTFTLLIQKNFANETWTLDTIGLYSMDDEDSLIQLKLRHLIFSNTEVWLGVDIFSGDDEGQFGQFSERDRVLLGFEIGF